MIFILHLYDILTNWHPSYAHYSHNMYTYVNLAIRYVIVDAASVGLELKPEQGRRIALIVMLTLTILSFVLSLSLSLSCTPTGMLSRAFQLLIYIYVSACLSWYSAVVILCVWL